MSVEQKIREVMDELQAQVIDGYAGPVNGWSTLKDEATQSILQIIESDVIGEYRVYKKYDKCPVCGGQQYACSCDVAEEMLQRQQRANLREEK